ncbi:MAG: hypothetical protein MJ252_11530 [archaeon]|nr:hypothetical protein [archaeon]
MRQWENCTYTEDRNFINPDNISYNLQCSICSDVFNNPIRLDCGHTYCYACIEDWMKRSTICPSCRTTIVESEMSRDLLAFNMIEELEVTCNNENYGCPWKGTLSNLKNHLKFCNDNIDCLKAMPSNLSTPMKSGLKRQRGEMNDDQDGKSDILSNISMENNQNLGNQRLSDRTVDMFRRFMNPPQMNNNSI